MINCSPQIADPVQFDIDYEFMRFEYFRAGLLKFQGK